MSGHGARGADHGWDRPEALPPALRAAVDLLREVPAGAPGAAERAAAAALAAQRAAVAARPAFVRPAAHAGRRAAAWAAAAVAAAGLGAGAWRARVGGPNGPNGGPESAVAAPAVPHPAPAVPAAGSAAARDEAPRPVRFTLRAPGAGQVALVGDFNRWDRAATPLARGADGWAVEVPLAPGRHAYAFVVDGRRWVLDPAAPSERDPDFGRKHSVTVVGAEGGP